MRRSIKEGHDPQLAYGVHLQIENIQTKQNNNVMRSAKYNSLKKRVLRKLVDSGKWISVPALAAKLELGYPERGLYSYLRRLARMGLVVVGKDARGRLFYRATERGAERLKFLNERG